MVKMVVMITEVIMTMIAVKDCSDLDDDGGDDRSGKDDGNYNNSGDGGGKDVFFLLFI